MAIAELFFKFEPDIDRNAECSITVDLPHILLRFGNPQKQTGEK